ncbi:MAG: glycosyltransferase family 39 protein [Candidatus Handelsmanbacteria bacterium]|nr:glycosyltransferase family 39 protein [Candidatus Handelsmanbacteria bacterium]
MPWLALLGVGTLFKLWLVAGVELGKDEAAYWFWGQHLDATYALLPFSVFKLAHFLYPGSEWFLRLGSVLCGVASAVLIYHLCRRHGLERSICLWATAAFATSHWIWHTSSYLHPDGFLVACWLLALWLARRSIGQPSPALYAGMGVAAGLAMLSKYSGAFLAAGLFFWLLATLPRTERARALLCYTLAGVLVAAPLLYAQLSTGFFLPTTLGTLSQIASQPIWRLPLFLLDPLLFVSPLLLWLLYRAFARSLQQLCRKPSPELLLALLPALMVLIAFGFFALFRGQIKGNWILPAFLGLWPWAFERAKLPVRPTRFLTLMLFVGLVHALPIGLALRYPALAQNLGEALAGEALDASYVHLVSAEDRQREPSYSWSERVGEYGGWQAMADDLEQVLAREGLPPSVPLLSSQYGIVFAMAYYNRTGRPCFTVADPRFLFLTDFFQQSGSPLPAEVLWVARAGSPLPHSLQRVFPRHQLLVSLPRTAPGCASMLYRIFLLQPGPPVEGVAVERVQGEGD